ncbi:MAG TPA: hypothetical protein VK536_05520 [Candidatus Limnocylindrales bacterium]|nr:hypothetical protein [Candidatus Limnocylindrales bacterium]
MNIQTQNHVKIASVILIVLGMLSVPADLPYAVYIASILGFLGVLGYALAHYLADPATATADLNSAIQGVANTINSIRNAAASPSANAQTVDPNVLTADITSMLSQLVTKYSQAQAAVPTAPSAKSSG